jgi:MoxR-like ATPase
MDAYSEEIKRCQATLDLVKREIAKVVVGQKQVVNALLRAILSDGHVIVSGVPGVAKTLLVRALAQVTSAEFNRIQFTPDLLPTDITGVNVYDPKKGFYTVKGPIFSNFILADEINRSPSKVQSALLEAMQEKQVTIGRETFVLKRPFFVLATLNPIETSGIYPLPEAQLDRFLFKVNIDYPSTDEERDILEKNIDLMDFNEYKLKTVVSLTEILSMQELTKKIYMSEDVAKYIINLVNATRNPERYNVKLGKYIQWGASPRASIGLFITSKADALLKGSNFVSPQNVKDVALDVLRHRVLLNYEAEAENVKVNDIIHEILQKVPVK